MDFITLTGTSTFAFTNEALNMINFFVQFFTLGFALVIGLLAILILIHIFK